MTADDRAAQLDQLDGWKEIAAYIGRSVRTAQRWERKYGLPVRRVAATGDEVVYARRAEIDEWKNRRATWQGGNPDSMGSAAQADVPVAQVLRDQAAVIVSRSYVRYIAIQAALFGFLVAEGLVAEMSYAFGRDGALALRAAPLVFISSGACVTVAFWADLKLIKARRSYAIVYSLLIFLGGMSLLLVGLLPWLPADATIQARFQTRTIQSGYVKNTLYYFVPLIVIFVLPTFHAVAALEKEAEQGDRDNVARLLRRVSTARPLRGLLMPRTWHLSVLLAAAVVWAIVSTNYLLDRLLPGPYMNLFSILVEVRVAVWFVIALSAVAWYSSSLGNLERVLEFPPHG